MESRCGMWLRGATAALLSTTLLMAPVAAHASVAEPSDAPLASESTTLVLRPICRRADLHRFAVTNEAGPATAFTVAASGDAAEDAVPIAAGETVYFWVDAGADAGGAEPVEITWPDGSAAAVPVSDPCNSGTPDDPTPQDPTPEDPPVGDVGPDGPAVPPPAEGGDATPDIQPEAPASPEMPDAPGASEFASPDRPGLGGGTDGSSQPDDTVAQQPPGTRPSGTPPAGAAGADAITPRPRPSDSAFACPGGWVAVDTDGDRAIDGSDSCERVVETGAVGETSNDMLTLAALLITVVLLVGSIGIGAVRSGRITPPRR